MSGTVSSYIRLREYIFLCRYVLRHIQWRHGNMKDLAEPNRFQIVELLRDGPPTNGDNLDHLLA
jgi:hypothetical protein